MNRGTTAMTGRARVVVLAGPSGSGKSRLAARLSATHGWPILRLDDFYRDGDDPDLPCDDVLGIPDWDDPASWRGSDAAAALVALVDTCHTVVPDYDISISRAVGQSTISREPADLILTEGIFAAEIIARLKAAGVLHSAWVIRQPTALTFLRRLVRDLAERRKPPLVLVRRGWALARAEDAVVERQVALGGIPARPAEVETALAAVEGPGFSVRVGP